MKDLMHELYWKILRASSTPRTSLALILKEAYTQRAMENDDELNDNPSEADDLEIAYMDFLDGLKEDYQSCMSKTWHKDLILNKIYGETIFLKTFLEFNLDMSYKLADYSIGYAMRQAYLGLEDIGKPIVQPVQTAKNLYSLGKAFVGEPFATTKSVTIGLAASLWHQPIRAVTSIMTDTLLTLQVTTLADRIPSFAKARQPVSASVPEVFAGKAMPAMKAKFNKASTAIPTPSLGTSFDAGKLTGLAFINSRSNLFTPTYSGASATGPLEPKPLTSATMKEALLINDKFTSRRFNSPL